MKINICQNDYNIEKKVDTLLDALLEIKKYQNSSLAFKSGCRSGVCGSCAIKVNGIERLACKTSINDGDIVEPLKNMEVIKDLVVQTSMVDEKLKQVNAFFEENSNEAINIADEKKIDKETNCILCSSCYSSCPVFEVNKEFAGPYALVRAYRYVSDKKENCEKTKIDAVQQNGVWDCTLCGNCNMVCPAKIDIKSDIMQLRNKSVQYGYSDPNMMSFDNSGFDSNNDFMGSPSFQGSQDFGFDPNGF